MHATHVINLWSIVPVLIGSGGCPVPAFDCSIHISSYHNYDASWLSTKVKTQPRQKHCQSVKTSFFFIRSLSRELPFGSRYLPNHVPLLYSGPPLWEDTTWAMSARLAILATVALLCYCLYKEWASGRFLRESAAHTLWIIYSSYEPAVLFIIMYQAIRLVN